MILRVPSEQEFEQVCKSICELELDNRDLKQQQFVAAFFNGQLVGFGRLREYADCSEICSLGVLPAYEKQGIATAIVHRLIKQSSKNVYVVTIIPEFFQPFGFQPVENFPPVILDKLNYCTSELVVPENYVVMLLGN
jgi:N-acetylglutamate synthase-like GNAT family acetyltransferase